jgi:hypothetical protein
MTRTVSVSVAAAIAEPITAPGYLLEIEFNPPVLLCSRGDVTVNGNDWQGWSFTVSGIGIDATSAKQTGTLTVSNRDFALSTLMLEQGVADRAISIWAFYGDAPADDDPVLIFSGVGAQGDIDTNSASVKIALRQEHDNVQFAPAHYITVEQGFSMLPPAGTIIQIGRTSYILEPDSF